MTEAIIILSGIILILLVYLKNLSSQYEHEADINFRVNKADYDRALARQERHLLVATVKLEAENECLRSRIQDLCSDIDLLRNARDSAENAVLTFFTTIKRD